jgi:hypothetical protein
MLCCVETRELLHALADTAEAAGFEVRPVGGSPLTDGGPAAESGVVRLRGRVIVLLSRGDPPERRVEVLADALREHASAWLEANFVAPAVRDRVTPG